jgi:hypothetical protein
VFSDFTEDSKEEEEELVSLREILISSGAIETEEELWELDEEDMDLEEKIYKQKTQGFIQKKLQ